MLDAGHWSVSKETTDHVDSVRTTNAGVALGTSAISGSRAPVGKKGARSLGRYCLCMFTLNSLKIAGFQALIGNGSLGTGVLAVTFCNRLQASISGSAPVLCGTVFRLLLALSSWAPGDSSTR